MPLSPQLLYSAARVIGTVGPYRGPIGTAFNVIVKSEADPEVDWNEGAASNPDGDAELAEVQVARFRLVGCECCGSNMLKPDVVFFGENVPRHRVQGALSSSTKPLAIIKEVADGLT